MQTPQLPNQIHDDEIDLRQLINVLWRRRVLISALGVAGAALGVGASMLSVRYVSKSLLLTPGVSISDYKQYKNAFSSKSSLLQYLRVAGHATSAEGKLLEKNLLDEPFQALDGMFDPEVAFTERAPKAFGIKSKINDDAAEGDLIGMNITFSHSSPTNGKPVRVLGDYIRNAIILAELKNSISGSCDEYTIKNLSLRGLEIQNNFAIEQEQIRINNIAKIAYEHDKIVRGAATLLTDESDSGRSLSLSLSAQLIATGIKISDLRFDDAAYKRAQISGIIKQNYYCQAKQILQKSLLTQTVGEALKNHLDRAFDGQDRSIDIIEQTWEELSAERTRLTDGRMSAIRFSYSPEDSEIRKPKNKPLNGLLLGGILGGGLGMLLGLFRAWWRRELTSGDTAV